MGSPFVPSFATPFVYQALPSRVVFGAGSLAKVREEIERLGISKVLILSTPQQFGIASEVASLLGSHAAGLFDRAAMHVPVEIARAASDQATRLNAQGIVAVGGGSTTGLAKAIALELELPILAIPTTYAGSEMTPIWGLTEAGVKRTGRDVRVLPKTVIYDPALTLSLPVGLSATSGINAIAHCVEALYAQDANPVISLIAEEGIRALASSLPLIRDKPNDIGSRGAALYGAWLAGLSLGSVGMALHHKLCHTLGGTWNLPHAETHTVVLPHATAYNAPAAPIAMARVARALDADSAAEGLYDLAASLDAPTSLAALGMQQEDLDRAAELACRNPYYNPRPIEFGAIRELLADAFAGRRPA